MEKHKGQRYHFLYRTTNLVNKKYYFGVHSTYNLGDGYLGSGKKLTRAVKKYGEENFKIEILEFFETREEVLLREKEIVNETCLQDPLCMNLKEGGNGGFTKEQSSKGTKTMLDKIWKDEGFIKRNSERKSKLCKELREKGIFKNCDWTGRKHSEKTKNKMSLKAKERIGEKNSQYGTCWITNGSEVKKIKKEELQFWINQNWKKGRK